MKNQNLIVSMLMLLGTSFALATSTFAWFSVNSTVEVNGLDVKVQAAEGIQVSSDAYTWKSVVEIADLQDSLLDNAGAGNYTTNTNHVPDGTDPMVIVPVSTIGSQTVGNFEMFGGTLVEGASTTLTTTALTDDNTTTEYVAFDIFLKTSTAEDIYLMTPSAITYTPADVESTVGLEWATRVAFFDQGVDAASNPVAAQALASGTSASQVIWEPNALNHTAAAISNGAVAGTKYATYYGVKAANTGLSIVEADQQADADGAATNFGNVTTITPDTDVAPYEIVAGNIIFHLEPGINKIRIYIWVEGQDIDCENAISLGVGYISGLIKFQKV